MPRSICFGAVLLWWRSWGIEGVGSLGKSSGWEGRLFGPAGCLSGFSEKERGWRRAQVAGFVRPGSLRECPQPFFDPWALEVGSVLGGGASVIVRPLVFGACGVASVSLCPERLEVFLGVYFVSYSSCSPEKSAILGFLHLFLA